MKCENQSESHRHVRRLSRTKAARGVRLLFAPRVARVLLVLLPLIGNTGRGAEPQAERVSTPRSRAFEFTYEGVVTGQAPGAVVRVWLPVPLSSEDQQVRLARIVLPSAGSFAAEPK